MSCGFAFVGRQHLHPAHLNPKLPVINILNLSGTAYDNPVPRKTQKKRNFETSVLMGSGS